MKLHIQVSKDEDDTDITEKWLEVESIEEAKAVKFLRDAIVEQLEAKMVAETDLAIEAVFDTFNVEGFGVFANYEKLLITNLE